MSHEQTCYGRIAEYEYFDCQLTDREKIEARIEQMWERLSDAIPQAARDAEDAYALACVASHCLEVIAENKKLLSFNIKAKLDLANKNASSIVLILEMALPIHQEQKQEELETSWHQIATAYNPDQLALFAETA